jgi:hypothetical protein
MRRRLLLVSSGLVAFGALVALSAQNALATPTVCNTVLSGTVNGNVVVPSGDTCIAQGVTITGSLTVDGGGISLENSTVGGNVAIQNNATNAAGSMLCGNSIGGSYAVRNESNGSTWWLGESVFGCTGGSVGGNVVLTNNSDATLELESVTVGGSVTDTNNSDGGFNSSIDNELEGVTAQGTARCANNTPPTVNDSASVDDFPQANSFAGGNSGCPVAAS